MKYSTWIWTEDGTPMYSYTGHMLLPNNNGKSIPGNCGTSCHRECGGNSPFGMSKDRCYCLDDTYEADDANTQENPCPGNFDELCGDANGMSVYTFEFPFKSEDNGLCAYAKRGNDLSISVRSSGDCGTKTRYVCCAYDTDSCDGSICKNPKMTWMQAYHTCQPVKLNNSTAKDIVSNMGSKETCWIGLFNAVTIRWINGDEEDKNYYDFDFNGPPLPHCLTVSMFHGTKYLSWKPCSEEYASICEVLKPHTSDSPQPHPSSPPSSTIITAVTETDTPSLLATTDASTNVFTDSPSGQTGSSSGTTTSQNNKTGAFIGLGVGCAVLVLAVVIAVILVRRQKKLCFGGKDSNQPMHIITATQNTTSDLEVPTQSNTPAYTDITLADMTDVKPMSSAVPMAAVRPRVQNYDNTFPSDGDENDYNVLSPPGKHHAPGTSGKPINNHPGPVNGDYDTAQAWGQSTGSTGLNNSGPSAATRAPETSQGDNDEVGQHDPEGAAEVYDHLRDGEGGHATSQQGKTPREVDDSYSHIGRTNKGFEENAYDIASTRQTEDRRDDTYNHTDSVDDNAGDTNDYYNTRSLFRDNNERLVRQDDIPDNTDVYSRALRISDA